MVVDIEDIWDEFNYGVAGQPALRDFLAYASKEWVSAPKYVVLAGDGSFDYKNKLGLGGNFVPAMNVKTPFGLFASDNWLANLDGKGAPEIAIGRLPATSPASLSKIIDRIEARERAAGGAWTNKLLMLADNADYAGNFPVDSDRIATTVPATTTTSKIYLNGIAPATARSLTIQQINQGLGFVNYIGHGSLSTLASEGILRNSDLPMLANTNQPFVLTAATCLVGYYTYPGFNAMSELLLRDGTGGAAAVWSASGMSQNEHAVVLNEAFYKAALAGGSVRVGDAVLSALREYEKQGRPSYMLDIYVLLGDPAMRLR
jgi:hypothetical protein